MAFGQNENTTVLQALMDASPQVVSHNIMIEAYWNDDNEHDERFLESADRQKLLKNIHDCMSKVRKKLESLDDKNHIENIPGTGYRFIP